jgi:copper homeostasis protein CutC
MVAHQRPFQSREPLRGRRAVREAVAGGIETLLTKGTRSDYTLGRVLVGNLKHIQARRCGVIIGGGLELENEQSCCSVWETLPLPDRIRCTRRSR